MMRLKQLIGGAMLIVLALVIVITYVLWEDGKQFAAGQKAGHPVPSGVASPSYLDGSRFQWKTAEQLRQYAIEHQQERVNALEAKSKP